MNINLVSGVTNYTSQYWIPVAEQAIKVIYKLAEHPDIICGDILKKLVAAFVTEANPAKGSETEEGDYTSLHCLCITCAVKMLET